MLPQASAGNTNVIGFDETPEGDGAVGAGRILTGLAPDAGLDKMATAFFAMGAQAVLLKRGHAERPEAVDWLLRPGVAVLRFAALRQPGTRRGTGCTLASAIAARLARGDDLATACAEAKHYLNGWW